MISFKPLVTAYKTAQRNNPEDHIPQLHLHFNFTVYSKFRAYKNSVLRRIFEVTWCGGLRILNDLHNLYYSSDSIRMINEAG
jgi:hypothetical protein